MIADRNQTELVATFRFLDDNGNAINSLAWDTAGIVIQYKPYLGTWTNITLQQGVLGSWVTGGFVADGGGDGMYELGVPNEARRAGHRTLFRFKLGAFQYRYDAIDYVSVPSTETSSLTMEFSIPGTEETFTTASQIYIKELGRQITFEANQDVSLIPLVLIIEDGDGVDQYIIQDEDMDKTGGDTVVITLPDGFTAEEKTLEWAIRNRDNERLYGTGSISVTYAPYQG